MHHIALAASFDDLTGAVLGLFIELVARFFEFLNVALQFVKFDLARLPCLLRGVAVMRQRFVALAVA